MFVYNSSEHRSTGKQPYELLYGKTLVVPTSFTKPPGPRHNYDDYQEEFLQRLRKASQIARDRLILQKQKTKSYYDHSISPITVHVGDQVLLQDKAWKGKLSAKWIGPFEVIEINSNENITIRKGRKSVKIHKNLIKPFIK